MHKRLISLMLALVYFSASIAFSTPHSHEGGDAVSHDCVACVWHLGSISDAPTPSAKISVPLIAAIHAPAPDVRAQSSTPTVRSDRGPPVFS